MATTLPPDRAASRQLSIRLRSALRVAHLAGAVSRTSGSGSGGTLPGRVLLALVPDAIGRLSARHRIVLVSGTNGKTTTTLLLARALATQGDVISNTDGANLASGLANTFASASHRGPVTAVLEIDEVALVKVLPQVEAAVLVLLNLSRDQLDRTAEVAHHVRSWGTALAATPGTCVVANRDDALVVAAVLAGRPDGRDVIWVAAEKTYREDVHACPVCDAAWDGRAAEWRCRNCGLSRPQARWQLGTDLTFSVDGRDFDLDLQLPGRVNAANALMATAAAAHLGVDIETAVARMQPVTDVQGRYARTTVAGHPLRLLLAKNPEGWTAALEQAADSLGPVVLAVNARAADGHDPSWLWDVPFEVLKGRDVIACGERVWDLALRLTYAEVEHVVAGDVRAAIALLPAGGCDVIANYTAFVAVRNTHFAST